MSSRARRSLRRGCTCHGSTSTGWCRRRSASRRRPCAGGSCSSAGVPPDHQDDHLLSVALEAGYASHEAFTRAFRRAFGRAPSALAGPADRLSDRGGGRCALQPAGRPVAARREDGDDDGSAHPDGGASRVAGRRDGRASRWAERRGARPPDRGLGRGHRRRPDAALAALPTRGPACHVARVDPPAAIRLRRRARRDHRLDAPAPRRRRTGLPTDVRAIVDEDRLEETFIDTTCDPPSVFTYGGVVAHVLTFAAHRRTLVCGALIDEGITDLGDGDPRLWVAQPT